jgi:PAS domain S-box-containing protein
MYQPLRISGEATRVIVTVVDITERKRAEEALQQSELRFRLMGETTPYGVWMANAEGDIVYFSQVLLDLIGMTMAQVQESGWTSRLPQEDVQTIVQRWRHCVRTGENWEQELRILGIDGEYRTILSRGKPVRDSHGHIIAWAGINLDISNRKRSEEALIRCEKLASVGRLAATMAHEVNNPLAAAMNSVFLARNNAENPPFVCQYLGIADAQLQRIEHITQQALGVYSESSVPVKVSVTGVLDSVVNLLRKKSGSRR